MMHPKHNAAPGKKIKVIEIRKRSTTVKTCPVQTGARRSSRWRVLWRQTIPEEFSGWRSRTTGGRAPEAEGEKSPCWRTRGAGIRQWPNYPGRGKRTRSRRSGPLPL